MMSAPSDPLHPLQSQCQPSGMHAAVQTWENLLFLHGQVPCDLLCQLLPQGLDIDLFEGMAWVSVVLMTVQDASPALGLPLPWISFYHQANVRTYVKRDGIPGIWLLSTHVDSELVAYLTRRFFHLSCCLAHCHGTYSGGMYRFEMFGRDEADIPLLSFSWLQGEPHGTPLPGSLDSFLLDRYAVYMMDGERLFRARIHHGPWSIRGVRMKKEESRLMQTVGLPRLDLHRTCFARMMPRVRIWAAEQVAVIPSGGG